MGISAGTVWEVRATGSDDNGGLFYASQPNAGTDYSQQDSPQLSVSDIVTNGTTTVTSATGGFTAAMIGNGINVAGVCYMIATRASSNTITVDRTISSASGQTGKVGGALASVGFAVGQATGANYVWVKAGSYTLTSASANVSGGTAIPALGSAAFPFVIEGYGSVRGDKGTKPVIDAGSIASIIVFKLSSAFTIVDNLEVRCASGSSSCIQLNAASTTAIRCKVTSDFIGIFAAGAGSQAIACEMVGGPIYCTVGPVYVYGCVGHGGGNFVAVSGNAHFVRCLSYGHSGAGFDITAGLLATLDECSSYGNGGNGFTVSASGLRAINCLAVSNGGYGFAGTAASAYTSVLNCATYNNTSGAYNNLSTRDNCVALTGDPFTASGSGDFSLNNTSGAGAACRAAGALGAFPGGLTTGYLDIGAVQHQSVGGGGGSGGGGGRLSLSL